MNEFLKDEFLLIPPWIRQELPLPEGFEWRNENVKYWAGIWDNVRMGKVIWAYRYPGMWHVNYDRAPACPEMKEEEVVRKMYEVFLCALFDGSLEGMRRT